LLNISDSIVAGNTANRDIDIAGTVAFSNGHNVFASDVLGNIAGDVENAAAGAIFASIDPRAGSR
jgi:hypothetical protein